MIGWLIPLKKFPLFKPGDQELISFLKRYLDANPHCDYYLCIWGAYEGRNNDIALEMLGRYLRRDFKKRAVLPFGLDRHAERKRWINKIINELSEFTSM